MTLSKHNVTKSCLPGAAHGPWLVCALPAPGKIPTCRGGQEGHLQGRLFAAAGVRYNLRQGLVRCAVGGRLRVTHRLALHAWAQADVQSAECCNAIHAQARS